MLDKPVEVTDVDQSSLPNKIKEMQQIADSAAIGKIIGNILNSDGTIKKIRNYFTICLRDACTRRNYLMMMNNGWRFWRTTPKR